jgi:hypothetical protein
MSDRQEYRKKARVCLAQAELLLDPQDCAAMLAIAQLYLKRTDQVGARLDRGTAHRDQHDQHPWQDS